MAMGITLAENRLDLLGDRLFIEDRGLEVGRDRLGPAHRHQRRHRPSLAGLDRRTSGGVSWSLVAIAGGFKRAGSALSELVRRSRSSPCRRSGLSVRASQSPRRSSASPAARCSCRSARASGRASARRCRAACAREERRDVVARGASQNAPSAWTDSASPNDDRRSSARAPSSAPSRTSTRGRARPGCRGTARDRVAVSWLRSCGVSA